MRSIHNAGWWNSVGYILAHTQIQIYFFWSTEENAGAGASAGTTGLYEYCRRVRCAMYLEEINLGITS